MKILSTRARAQPLKDDAVATYRCVRLPEKRVFYIDLGDVSGYKCKASLEELKIELQVGSSTKCAPITPKPYVETPYTEDQVEELMRCSADPVYFMTRYCFIQHPTIGWCLMDFKQRPYLEQLIDRIQKHGKVSVKHPRQAGISVTMTAYMLWLACFRNNQCLLMGVVNHAIAKHLRETMSFMHEHLPDWLRPPCMKYNSQHGIVFDNGSQVNFNVINENFAEGRQFSFVYLDSFAWVKSAVQEYVMQCILPGLSAGGGLVIASTPNKVGDTFYNLWQTAKLSDHNPLKTFTVTYWDLPITQTRHTQQLQLLLDREMFLRDYDGQFVSE